MDQQAVRDMAAQLGDVLPLQILSTDDRTALTSHMRVRRFREDETVYHESDVTGDIFVVFEGLVKVLLQDENGREALVALLGRGEFFGELALFDDTRRDTTVVSVVPTTALQMPRADCLAVLHRNPEAQTYMFRRLTSTIHRLSDTIEDVVFLDVPSRLAKYLLELHKAGGELPLTQYDLAAAVYSTRETVNKALSDFERRGLITVERRNVQILDETALEREIHR
jgi:CRP-like cAMP-binding protein